MKLTDLRAVVTGAASGMGRAFARCLVADGAQVVAVDVGDAVLALRDELGEGVHPVVADVSDEASVARMMDAAWTALGSVNGLVNCAGITRDAMTVRKSRSTGEISTLSLEDWRRVLEVNLTGTFLCARKLVRRMVADEVAPGVIVNISSTARKGNAGQANYAATKAAVVADTAVWAKEFAPFGVRVGAIAPGYVDTPMIAKMRRDILEKGLQRVPLGRAARPEEIYLGVKFIVECDYFTGGCIDISGGL